nr:uncharacterized protein LOC128669528 [Plodia interpunctella]
MRDWRVDQSLAFLPPEYRPTLWWVTPVGLPGHRGHCSGGLVFSPILVGTFMESKIIKNLKEGCRQGKKEREVEGATSESDSSMGTALSGSESEVENVPEAMSVKPSTSRRARGTRTRGRPPTTGEYVGLAKAKEELLALKRQEFLLDAEAQVVRAAKKARTLRAPEQEMKSAEALTAEYEKLPAGQIKEKVEAEVALIRTVATKSGNLKGTFVKELKQAAVSVSVAVEALIKRSSTEEMSKLQAENRQMREENSKLSSLVEELRREVADLRAEVNLWQRNAPEKVASVDAPVMRGDLERIVAEVARKAVAEERRRSCTQSDEPMVPSESAAPGARVMVLAPQPPQKVEKKKKRKKKKAGKEAPAASAHAERLASLAAGSHPETQQDEGWVKVTRRSRKVPKPVQGRAEAASQVSQRPKGRQAQLQPKLRPPRSAAVLIQLQPDAQKRGVTYKEVLSDAKSKLRMSELGIGGISIRAARTGARLLEIPGLDRGAKADALAKRLGEVLDAATVKVSRPVKCAELRVLGLDDSASQEEVQAAVAGVGGCAVDAVRVGEIRLGRSGKGTAWVRCPVEVARKVMAGPLVVGWVSTKVIVLPPKPLRCFRCLETGHVREECTAEVDRSGLCYRCGSTGHLARDCDSAPRCTVCAEAGRRADHRVGGKACVARPQRQRGRRPRAAAIGQSQLAVQPHTAEREETMANR